MKIKTAVIVAALLFALSAAIYALQIALFHDPNNTFFYMLQDWAFLPIQIAVVTIVVGMVISEMQRRERVEKTNMLASSFFSDGGTALMRKLLSCTVRCEALRGDCAIKGSWTKADFAAAAERVRTEPIHVSCAPADLRELKAILEERRLSMLVISSNPILFEHEEFTDMLWAVFHLTDEFEYRGDLDALSPADQSHLNDDCERALRGLLVNWLCHMSHLKDEYPYLFVVAANEALDGATAGTASTVVENGIGHGSEDGAE